MKKLILTALAAFVAGAATAQTITTMVSKAVDFHAVAGQRVACAINPTGIEGEMDIDYTIPSGKTLDGFIMLKGELK